jgi:probable HAF family extracellular repeat protein
MQRSALFALASASAVACADSASPTAGDAGPAFAKLAGTVVVTSIGPGSGGSEAHDVNDAGVVVGTTGTLFFTPSRAFIWTPAQTRGTAGTREDLGTLGGTDAGAEAINNAGHVVGSATTADQRSHPYLWTRTGGMQDLGLSPEWTAGGPADVNDSGQVAGTVVSDAGQRAGVWHITVDAAGLVHVSARETIPTLPGGGNSVARAMNGIGQVAGWVDDPASSPNRPVLWTPGAAGWIVEDLGLPSGDHFGTAEGVNDQGQVVGYSWPEQGCGHAVLWTTQGGRVTGMRALETLGECPAQAWAINDQSQIVGRMRHSRRDDAVMWALRADGTTASITDIGRLSATASSLALSVGAALGGMTEIVGLSRANDDNRATLWTVR